MKETKEMMEILSKNKREAQMRAALKKQREEAQKAKEKEQLHCGIIVVLAFILLVVIAIIGHNYLEDEYNKCMASGKSETTCNAIRSIDE